jgi:hypothetical protein
MFLASSQVKRTYIRYCTYAKSTLCESYNRREMTPFVAWPKWLQAVVVLPHAVLGYFAFWLWWPKSDREWRKFGWVSAYLLAFYLVMHFGFQAFK